MKYKSVYDKMPITVQNLMTSIYGRKLVKQRYGSVYKEYIIYLRKNFSERDHYKLQLENLNKFLTFAKENSKYYKIALAEIKFPITNLEVLKQIPELNKETLRTSINEIITDTKDNLNSAFTGGTTGKSLNVFYNREDAQIRMAYLDYFKERHGFYQGMRRASFTGKNIIPLKQRKKIFWRMNSSLNQLLFSSFHLTEENIPLYIQKLNQFKPQALDGFPSIMLELAKYINRNNIELKFIPKCIFPTAETLKKVDREEIEKAFKAKIRNQYASSEGAPFITECEKGSLHIDISTGVFEKTDEYSMESEILVTSFQTRGTPLIRYKIGDVIVFSDEKCSCSYDTPIVKEIIGRSTDYLITKERGKVSNANMSNTIKNLPNSIINIQFVQYNADQIEINIVVDQSKYTKSHEKDLINEIKIRLGKAVTLKLNYVKEIPKENSGKFRMVKNLMK